MLLSMFLSITITALFIKVVHLGLGRHFDPSGLAFPLENMPDYFKYLYVYAILIIFAYSFIKLSIGFFLLRLADRTRWRTFLIGTLAFLIAFTIGSTMAIIFQCIPVRAAYDLTLRPPTGYVVAPFAFSPISYITPLLTRLRNPQNRTVLLRQRLQESWRLQLLHQYRNGPPLRAHPHSHRLEAAGQYPDEAWSVLLHGARVIRHRHRNIQDANAVSFL